MTDEPTDRDLAARVVSNGDEEAFRLLYRRHAPGVYRFALRLAGGHTAEAEDLAQETWLQAARSLGRFQWKSSLRTWVVGQGSSRRVSVAPVLLSAQAQLIASQRVNGRQTRYASLALSPCATPTRTALQQAHHPGASNDGKALQRRQRPFNEAHGLRPAPSVSR